MRSISLAFSGLLLAGALLLPGSAEAARPISCPDVLFPGGACASDIGVALETCCPCDGFRNHGRYVRCRAHAINALRKADCLDRDARRTLKRCAARSTCGKPEGFVTCCLSRPGICGSAGFCEPLADADPNAPAIPCTINEQCPGVPKCKLLRGAEKCIAKGGSPGLGSCCGACTASAPLP